MSPLEFCIFTISVFIALIVQGHSWPANDNIFKRIVGGEESTPNKWPWQGLLLRLKPGSLATYKPKCGAVLIDPKWVVTTAACVFDANPSMLKVVLGEHMRDKYERKEQEFSVLLIHLHRRFLAETGYGYNIALLKLSSPADITDAVQVARLPGPGQQVPPGTKCSMVGWGSTQFKGAKSNVLQEVEVPVVSNQACKRNENLYSKIDTFSMLCAGYGDKKTVISGCDGDAGGSFACKRDDKWILQGIVSWGDAQCSGFYYSVMTRISSFVGWISEMMKAPALKKPTTCMDTHYFCAKWKNYCNVPYFKHMLKGYYCIKTCNAC